MSVSGHSDAPSGGQKGGQKASLTDDKRYSGKTGRDTNSNDANSLRRRLFVGNLATEKTSKAEVEEMFEKFGAIESVSLHNNFAFIQYNRAEDADKAVLDMHGKALFGKRIDVNLAGARRKTQTKDKFDRPPSKEAVVPENMRNFGNRPPRGRSRSPIRDRGDRLRDERALSPASRYEELYRRDDPYTRPRDPYDLHDPYSGRDAYPPRYERDYPPRDDPYYRSGYGRPPPPPVRPAIDCEIVALSKEETRYADEIDGRLRGIGLVCNIGFPPPELPLLECIDRIARAGTLYAVVISAQNSQHRSCTLNVLHGTRQEHRNMPLDHALSFVARNFDTYLKVLRDPYYGAPPPASNPYDSRVNSRSYPPMDYPATQPPVASRPALAGVEKKMSDEELTKMLEKLKREKEERERGIGGADSTQLQQYR